MDHKVESYFNIQACQNESLATELSEVKANLAELTVRQEEEADGRINKGWVFIILIILAIVHGFMTLNVRLFFCVSDFV